MPEGVTAKPLSELYSLSVDKYRHTAGHRDRSLFGQHSGHILRSFCSHGIDARHCQIEYFPIEKQQGTEGLILG